MIENKKEAIAGWGVGSRGIAEVSELVWQCGSLSKHPLRSLLCLHTPHIHIYSPMVIVHFISITIMSDLSKIDELAILRSVLPGRVI